MPVYGADLERPALAPAAGVAEPLDIEYWRKFVHSARGNSPVAYGSLRAAAERRTKARDDPGTHIMIGTDNGGRSQGQGDSQRDQHARRGKRERHTTISHPAAGQGDRGHNRSH